MKILLIIGFLVLGLTSVFGQGAFDPNCYFPTLGVPGEIDSVYGSKDQQHLGSYMHEFPPSKDAPEGSIAISGIPNNPPFLSLVSKSAPFPLHQLQANAKKSNLLIKNKHIFGHFRDRQHIDLLVYGINTLYWADENGDFDSGRYTKLWPKESGNDGFVKTTDMYVTDITSDSLLDVVQIIIAIDTTPHTARLYFVMYSGGDSLYRPGQRAFSSDSYQIENADDSIMNRSLETRFLQGDFRGTGREDLIASDKEGNWFFYRNDPPFSLEQFAQAIYNDTLLSAWENKENYPKTGAYLVLADALVSQILPHQPWDKAEDIMIGLQEHNSLSRKDHIKSVIRGNLNFGSSRIRVSENEIVLHNPWYYSSSFDDIVLPGMFIPCGDMTNSGNKMLMGKQGPPGHSFRFFYNINKAIDDKADMYYTYETQGGAGDIVPLDADGDEYGDVLISDDANTSQEDVDRGKGYVGTIHLIHGSKKIPVRLNPKYAVEEIENLKRVQMYAYPNPCERSTTLTFENCSRGVMYMNVINSSGVQILREEVVDVDGIQQYQCDLSGFPAGVYHIRLTCPADGWSASASVIKTGAAVTPWSLDLKKMIGR